MGASNMQGTDGSTTAPAKRSRNRRRQYIVNPAFQWKYVFTSAVTVFMASIVISLVLFTMLHQQARMRAMHPETYTADVAFVVLTFAGSFALLTAAAVGVWSIILSHRICGPIFVMERSLVELAKGRIPTLRPLRKKDEFKDFHATFVRTVNAIKAGKERERAALRKTLQAATAALDADDAARRDALQSVTRSLASLCHAIDEALGDGPTAPDTAKSSNPAAAAPIEAGSRG